MAPFKAQFLHKFTMYVTIEVAYLNNNHNHGYPLEDVDVGFKKCSKIFQFSSGIMWKIL